MNRSKFTKLFALVLMVCVVLSLAIVVSSAAEKSASLSFSSKNNRTSFSTSKQVWQQNGITLTNNKASSSSNVADYAGPARFYASSEIIVEAPGNISKIVFDANSNSYATDMKNSVGTVAGATVSVSSDKVTVTFTTPSSTTFKVAKLTAQVRMDSITVTYLEADADCAHENTEPIAPKEATCTEPGLSAGVKCSDCDAIVEAQTVIPAKGHTGGTATCEELAECSVCGNPYGEYAPHTYEDGYCTVCDAKQPAAVFDFGNKGGAAADGTEIKAAKSYTDGEYTLTITPVSKVYGSAYDAKGNSVLKFGTGDVAGSMNITVPNDVTSVVIYVAGYKANAATVTINGTAHTVVGKSNDGVYDAIEIDTTANKTISFEVTSGNRAMVDTIEFYVSESDAPVCEHENTSPVVDEATCHTAGSSKVVCDDCSVVISVQTIPAAHTYANGVCSVCNVVEAPVTGVPYKFGMYQGNNNGVYYINGSMANTYYFGTSANASEGLNVYLEETEGGYYLYTFVNGAKKYINVVVSGTHKNAVYEVAASTVYTVSKSTAYTTIGSDTVYFGTASNGTYNTVGTTSSTGFICEFYAAGDVDRITSAGVVLGTTLGMNFAVSVPAGVPSMTVEFAGKTYELTAKNLTDTTYQFSFRGIGPHQMAENIKATLLVDGVAVAEVNNYSVEKNLKAILALDASLANIVNAVLAYGDAAENYNKIEGGVTAPETETEVEITEENNKLELENADDFGFTAAGVNFDSDNKIYVKFYVVGEFKFFVNGEEVAIEKTKDGYYKFYTEALTATQFDDTFTFEIEANGVKATLVYSVNTYAYSMQNDADMGELAKALYVYGVAAEDYAN